MKHSPSWFLMLLNCPVEELWVWACFFFKRSIYYIRTNSNSHNNYGFDQSHKKTRKYLKCNGLLIVLIIIKKKKKVKFKMILNIFHFFPKRIEWALIFKLTIYMFSKCWKWKLLSTKYAMPKRVGFSNKCLRYNYQLI